MSTRIHPTQRPDPVRGTRPRPPATAPAAALPGGAIAAEALPAIVRAAARDDQRAWEQLVVAFTPAIKAVARRHRLSPFDQDDVAQRTWFALTRNIDRITEPSSLRFWLLTTARREALDILQERAREILSDDIAEHTAADVHEDDSPVAPEQRDAVREAVASMPASQQALISALVAEPPLSYRQVSERVGIPIGSIGPQRQRCLQRMRRDPRVAQLLDDSAPMHHPTRPLRAFVTLV